jgi:hypothetical protein
MSSFGFTKKIEKWSLCPTEYSEGTAVAQRWFGVLEGYCRGVGRWSCVIDHGYLGSNKNEFPPPLEILPAILFTKLFFNKDMEMS